MASFNIDYQYYFDKVNAVYLGLLEEPSKMRIEHGLQT